MRVKVKWQDVIKEIGNRDGALKELILEAEPIEERPEWERKLEDEQDRLLRCGGIPLMASRNIINFIRTEIIEKICEEIRLAIAPYYRDTIEAVKAHWLGDSK